MLVVNTGSFGVFFVVFFRDAQHPGLIQLYVLFLSLLSGHPQSEPRQISSQDRRAARGTGVASKSCHLSGSEYTFLSEHMESDL